MLLCVLSLQPPRRQLGDWRWVCRGAVGGRSNFWVCGRDTASRAQTRGRVHHVARRRKGSWVFPVTGPGTFRRGRSGGSSSDAAAAASPAGVAGVPGSGVGALRGCLQPPPRALYCRTRSCACWWGILLANRNERSACDSYIVTAASSGGKFSISASRQAFITPFFLRLLGLMKGLSRGFFFAFKPSFVRF